MNDTAAVPDLAGSQPDEPKTLAEAAYRRLRRDIIEGIHPPGEKLRVEHLKDHYAVGAGTLREALLLLVTDALVTVQGQRGFRVAPISLDDPQPEPMLPIPGIEHSLTLGACGRAFVLAEVGRATGDRTYTDAARLITQRVVDAAAGDGMWSGWPVGAA